MTRNITYLIMGMWAERGQYDLRGAVGYEIECVSLEHTQWMWHAIRRGNERTEYEASHLRGLNGIRGGVCRRMCHFEAQENRVTASIGLISLVTFLGPRKAGQAEFS